MLLLRWVGQIQDCTWTCRRQKRLRIAKKHSHLISVNLIESLKKEPATLSFLLGYNVIYCQCIKIQNNTIQSYEHNNILVICCNIVLIFISPGIWFCQWSYKIYFESFIWFSHQVFTCVSVYRKIITVLTKIFLQLHFAFCFVSPLSNPHTIQWFPLQNVPRLWEH